MLIDYTHNIQLMLKMNLVIYRETVNTFTAKLDFKTHFVNSLRGGRAEFGQR